jgi:archaemetzincin
VGRIDVSQFDCVRRPLTEIFGRTVILGSRLPVPKYAFNPTRGQYHSAAIMKRVESARQTEWDAAIGVSREDLFVPEVPFVFGEADRSTRSALLSLARLKPDSGSLEAREELLRRRLVSEAIHQVGLLRGLAHCPNNRCVMFYAASVAEIDKRGSSLCANCKKRLVALSS